jgi:hypothetical protein
MRFLFPFVIFMLPALSYGQQFNFSQDAWRFPPTEIDGTPIIRADNTNEIEVPRCNDGDINSSCSLTFSIVAGGFVLDVGESYFTDDIGSTYTFNLTIGQVVIPVVYIAGNPLTAVCDVDLTLESSGVYRFNGISPCPDGLAIPDSTIAAIEWTQAPEGVTRQRSTAFVTVGPSNVPPSPDGAAWLLAEPGDTLVVQ